MLVSPEQYDKLVTALDDAEDVAAFDEAMREEGPNTSWEQVKGRPRLVSQYRIEDGPDHD